MSTKPDYIRVSELSKTFKVSLPTLYKYLKNLNIDVIKQGNGSFIESGGAEVLKQFLKFKNPLEPQKPSDTTTDHPSLQAIKALEKQLEIKDSQIAEKDSQIAHLLKTIDQQQQLSAHDKKLIEELGNKVKAIEAPKSEEIVSNQEQASPIQSELENVAQGTPHKTSGRWWDIFKF